MLKLITTVSDIFFAFCIKTIFRDFTVIQYSELFNSVEDKYLNSINETKRNETKRKETGRTFYNRGKQKEN